MDCHPPGHSETHWATVTYRSRLAMPSVWIRPGGDPEAMSGVSSSAMSLFVHGGFTLHSGATSTWKIDCDALTDEDLETLAALIATTVRPFGQVEGVPRGGLRLAKALAEHATGPPERLLIVDDVLTTGDSMEHHRAGREAYGAVIFARGTSWPVWVKPLFAMPSLRE